MATIEQAQRQITQARTQLESQKKQARESRERLAEARKKIPVTTSQKALRQKRTGLVGRSQRRKIQKQKEVLQQKESGIVDIQKALTKYETEKLKPAESKIRRAKELKAAYEQIETTRKQAYGEWKIAMIAKHGEGPIQDIAKQFLEQRYTSRESTQAYSDVLEKANITGVESLTELEKKKYDKGFETGIFYTESISDVRPQTINVGTQSALVEQPTGGMTVTTTGGMTLTTTGDMSVTMGRSYAKDIPTTISEYKPSGGEAYVLPDKTFGQKILDIPSTILETARGYSGKQAEFASAESALGIGNVGQVGESYVDNKMVVNKIKNIDTKLDESYKKYQDLQHYEIPKFESQNKVNGKFDYNKLSEAKKDEYRKLQEKSNKYATTHDELQNKKEEIIKDTSKTFNFLGYKKEVEATKLTSPFGYVGEYVSTITEEMGAGAGEAYKDISLLTGKVSKTPFIAAGQLFKGEITGKEFLAGETKPDVVYDLFEGKARIPTEGDLTPGPLTLLQPSEVAKVTTGVYKTGAYFVPYAGAGIFASEIGESLSQVDYSPTRLIKEKPVEAAMLGAVVLGVGAIKGVKYLKKPIIKETQLGFQMTTRADEILGKRIRISKPEKGIGVKTEYLPSTRGKYIEYVEIKKPKLDLEAKEVIGVDLGKKVIYPEQKLSQFYSEGQLTQVYKIVNGKKVPIYEGVPYKAPGKYKDQLEHLTELFGEKKARDVLRYRQSSGKESFLKEGQINIRGSKATGEFTSTIEKPVIDIDKTLGIKTRGGRGEKSIIEVERVGVGTEKVGIGLEESTELILKTGKKNVVDVKGFKFKEGFDITISSGYKDLSKNIKDIKVQTLESVSVKKYTPDVNVISIDKGRTLLIKKVPVEEQITSFAGGGQKSSKQYLEQLYSQELKAVPPEILKKPKVTIKETQKIIPEIIEVPKTVTPTTSAYAGTGLYERTEGFEVFSGPSQKYISTGEEIKMTTIQPIALSIETRPVLVEQEKIKEELKYKEVLKQKDLLKFNQLGKQDSLIRQESKIKQTQLLKSAQALKYKTALKSKQTLVESLFSKQTTEKITKPIKPIKPKIRIIIKPKTETPFKDILEKAEEEKGKFSIFVKKKGEDIEIGKAKTKKKAKEKLIEVLKEELRASGFAEKAGKKVQLGKLPEGFRRSKVDPFRIVEEKHKRIKKKEISREAEEIQFFRGKSKKKGWF